MFKVSLVVISAFASLTQAGMDRRAFEDALETVNRKVAPMLQKEFGKKFLATGDWKKARTPASAGGSFYHPEIPGVSYEDSWGVHIMGWLARRPGFTEDSLQFVLCHELGHHIFGVDAEVAADHFAPTCLLWIWGKSDYLRAVSALPPIEKFRAEQWRKAGIPPEQIETGIECRRRAISAGFAGTAIPSCAI